MRSQTCRSPVGRRQYPNTTGMNSNLVLPMAGVRSIIGDHRPLIRQRLIRLIARGEHGFDTEDHSGFEFFAA